MKKKTHPLIEKVYRRIRKRNKHSQETITTTIAGNTSILTKSARLSKQVSFGSTFVNGVLNHVNIGECLSMHVLCVFFQPFSPNRDENKICLYIITTCSNIQVMRIREVITHDKMS